MIKISLDDEIDFDDLELDNIGSDPNIEFDLLWRIPVQEQLKKDDWNYLNSSIEYPHCNLSSETENLFTTLLNTVSTIYHCFQRNENVIYIGFFFYSSITEFVK